MPTVILMRSGRTAWEIEGRIQGALDIPLSPEGIKGVEQKAKDLRQQKIQETFCGADLPAVQSAQIVDRICGTRAKHLEEFREIDLGMWEGLLEKEALHRNPTAFRAWKRDPLSVWPPSGESVEECYNRISKAMRAVLMRYGEKTIALVCSGLVAGIVRCIARDAPLNKLWEYAMHPAATDVLVFR
jgi:broad specificity phosphatase PhoE